MDVSKVNQKAVEVENKAETAGTIAQNQNSAPKLFTPVSETAGTIASAATNSSVASSSASTSTGGSFSTTA